MFSLHDNTRIMLCRAAFVALCVVPTCGVLTWCVAVRGSGYRAAHERAIHDALGWRVQIEDVGLPKPGLTLYQDLEISDVENSQLLIQAPFLEVQAGDNETVLALPFPATVNGLRLDAILRSAERLLRACEANGRYTLSAQNVTLHLNGGDRTLVNCTGMLERDGKRTRLSMSFGLADKQASAASHAKIEMTIADANDAASPCSVSFKTGGTPLPCILIGSYWPAALRLGTAATFDGRITATRSAGRWNTELAGKLHHVDLSRLMESFPHKLTGSAEIQIDHAEIVDGRIEQAAGKLVAGPGIVSRSLLHAAQQHLGFEPSRQTLLGRDNHLVFRELNLAFDIDQRGLALRGEFSRAPGAVLVDEKQVLVRQGAAERVPVVNLLRTLVPQSAVHVPATRETSPLAALLPVPALTPQAGQEESLPQARAISIRP
jgi:hypothetical protein